MIEFLASDFILFLWVSLLAIGWIAAAFASTQRLPEVQRLVMGTALVIIINLLARILLALGE